MLIYLFALVAVASHHLQARNTACAGRPGEGWEVVWAGQLYSPLIPLQS